MNGPRDPFAHLHDEAYADAFAGPGIGWRDAVAMGGRRRLSLAGRWRFTPDLFDEGLRQRWFELEPAPPSTWDRPRDYDGEGAETLDVPACWTCARPDRRFFEGSAWYARDFEWAPGRADRLVLRVGAANYEARVFLNGRFLGSHRGGSTPFFVELTARVRNGTNHLLIQVNNERRADRVPMRHFDWFNDGGLYREIDLVPLPSVFIRAFHVSLAPRGIAAEVVLSDPVSGTARVAIPGLGVAFDVPVTDGRGTAAAEAAPTRWAPETPRLYEVEARFGQDRILDRVGFREIRVDGTDILLNGEPLYLRGICVHEDDVALGKVTSDGDIRRRLAHARELHCNFLRLVHYPHHERVAELADEHGCLLWAEIPVYWAIDFANPDTYADAENQLLELIARDRNRVSVVVWGVGNENADTDARYAFMSRLAAAARAADPARLVGAACLINREAFRIEDRLAARLDILGLNEYFGWYERDFAGLERLLANSRPDRPVVVTEMGADALAGFHGGADELFTEECQAEVYRRQLQILDRAAYVRGVCPWILYDYRSERRQTRYQRGFNRKGLIAEDKTTKKLAFGVLRDHYAKRAARVP